MEENLRLLTTYVSDMLALERSILRMLEQQAADPNVKHHVQALQIMERMRDVIRAHTDAVDAHLSGLSGARGTLFKDVATMIAGLAAGMLESVRSHPVAKMLRDDYTALSLAAVSYTMLHATALGLRDFVVAEMARKHLEDLTPLIVDLSEIVPVVVVHELARTIGTIDIEAGTRAVDNTHRAWSRETLRKAA